MPAKRFDWAGYFCQKAGFKFMECLLICLETYFIQHMGSFNYKKIRTMGAVLVAISIPIFTSQLEKAREGTDLANIRSAYAEASVKALDSADGTGTATVEKAVSTGKFDKVTDKVIGGVDVSNLDITTGSTITVTVSNNTTTKKETVSIKCGDSEAKKEFDN